MEIRCGESRLAGRDVGTSDTISEGLSAEGDGDHPSPVILSFEELQMLLTEVEAVINSRPLTHLHTDCSEPSSLTPVHFLVGQRLTTLPPQPAQPTPVGKPVTACAARMTKRWQYRQKLINDYWNGWRKKKTLPHGTEISSSRQLKQAY